MTNDLDLPDLDWVDGKADVSKWFGEGYRYSLEQISDGNQDGDWACWFYEPTDKPDLMQNMHSEVEAEQAAQAHFHARLQEPMDFSDAMKAWARGCETIDSLGFRYRYNKAHYLVVLGESPSALWEEPSVFKSMTERTHTFYFPSKPATQERVYAKKVETIEAWRCPECGKDSTTNTDFPWQTCDCKFCGVTLHRPKETQ